MFKYLLLRGLQDIFLIFNDSEVKDPPHHREALLKMVNSRAAVIWKNLDISFVDRVRECKLATDPAVSLETRINGTQIVLISEPIHEELNRIFRAVYNKREKIILIGQTNDEAYQLQDDYACQIVELLMPIGEAFASRAIARLRVAYGRNSIPLLSMSSVAELWNLCCSIYYRDIIFFVSSLSPTYAHRLTNSRKSFTSGSSHLRRCRKCTNLGATTFPRSTGSSDLPKENKKYCSEL